MKHPCPVCGGDGEIAGMFPLDGGEGIVDKVVCPRCGGAKYLGEDGEPVLEESVETNE